LVRKIAREHNVNLSQVSGTGLGGRITKQDIMAFLERTEATAAPGASAPAPARAPQPPAPAAPAPIPGDLVPATQMRKIIAQRMIESRRTSAHVHSMFEVDLTRIVNLPQQIESRLRAAPWRTPDVHAVFRARGDYCASAISHCQCVYGR